MAVGPSGSNQSLILFHHHPSSFFSSWMAAGSGWGNPQNPQSAHRFTWGKQAIKRTYFNWFVPDT